MDFPLMSKMYKNRIMSLNVKRTHHTVYFSLDTSNVSSNVHFVSLNHLSHKAYVKTNLHTFFSAEFSIYHRVMQSDIYVWLFHFLYIPCKRSENRIRNKYVSQRHVLRY